jgi:hypothetical protein
MHNSSEMTPWGAYKAWARSMPVRFALVLMAGVGIGRSEHSILAGLAGGIAMLIATLIGVRVEERRRMRRETREHNARLSQW